MEPDFIFTGENDSDISNNLAMINLNIVDSMKRHKVKKVLFILKPCMYPQEHQLKTDVPTLTEDMAYPRNPDSEYGWEKLFSERLYLPMEKTMVLMLEYLDSIIFLDQRELMLVVEKNLSLCVEK